MSSLDVSTREEVRKIALGYALQNKLRHGQAAVGPVLNKVIGRFKEHKSMLKEISEIVKDVVEHVNALSIEEVKKLIDEYGIAEGKKEEVKGLPPLPNTEGWKVIVTRFAPNPDFVIHLGNARAALLSYEYARLYNGRFVLRFEDTDPRIKRPLPEAYELIREDLKWLSIRWDEEYIQSLRMELYYGTAKKLLEIGAAYVDLCSPDTFRELRNLGKACPHRDEDPSISLERFEKILMGEYGEGEAVIRIKTDLSHTDPAVRDWVMFRIIDTTKYPHPLTGDRYRLWPTYNFAAAVDDHFMGVSHVLRGREHTLNTLKQQYLYRYLGWRYPEVLNFGRVGIEGFILSKSWIKTQLKDNPEKFMGFDDIRFATLSSLRRRGIAPETIKQIIMELGVRGVDAKISWANISAVNRKTLDPRSKRVFIVCNPIKVIIRGLEAPLKVVIPFHPTNDLGSRAFTMSRPEVYISKDDLQHLVRTGCIRLMEFANIRYINTASDGIVEAEYLSKGLEDAKKLGAQIVQWVPVESAIKVVIHRAHNGKLKRMVCIGENSLLELQQGEIIQMVRLGFGRIDRIKRDSITVVYSHE
ncbi:MAG: glutamate--tRNA ligase [Ignisphaera sp.]|nr:glutamate--tRNA ligase [Ignisphaera sp.]MCX8167816.1 glutamate--tRNA ligase [Ignisphaera sp.]MDW8085819.1 glutamate--tRNA ligase [Ignisphaera sp.]